MVLQGHAALIIAATRGHAAVLEYLLHKNATVDLKSQDVSHTVKTPAHVCVSVLTLHDVCMNRTAKHCGLRKGPWADHMLCVKAGTHDIAGQLGVVLKRVMM